MFINNLKLASRQLSKNKVYAAINIFGLAVAIAASLLIWRVLRYETSFNKNFDNYDRIGRAVMVVKGRPEGDTRDRGICLPAMIEAQNSVPQFVASSRVHEDWPTFTMPGANLSGKKTRPGEGQLSFFAEPGFLKIFDLKWLAGDPNTALDEVGSTVLSRKAAENLFGNVPSALGQALVLDNNVPVIVRGVFEDLPQNCDLPLFSLTSYKTLQANADAYYFTENNWGSTSSSDQLFYLLKDKKEFPAAAASLAKVGQVRWNEVGKSRGLSAMLEAQPLADLHYDEEAGTSSTETISRTRLWILGSIGLLVLAMACFNFINLATAVASIRSREVGVRKAIGSSKSALIAQFLTETSLIVLFSVALGIGLAQLSLPFLKKIAAVPADQPFLSDPLVWAFLATVAVVVTMLSGLYPSMVLAGMSPVRALKNESKAEGGSGILVRKGLVITQFAIAQALIIGAVVAVSQLNFVRNMDMGFQKDLVLTTSFTGDSVRMARLDGLKSRLQQIPTIESVSFSSDVPSSGSTSASNFYFDRKNEDLDYSMTMKYCDVDFLNTYGIELVAGQFYAASDTARSYVINETACRKLGITPEAAIGNDLRLGTSPWRPVCGVVKDFHAHSAHRAHQPLLLMPTKEFYSSIGLKISPTNIPQTVAAVQKIYDETFPEQVFESTFFDEDIAEFYEKEARFAAFCKGVAGLAVLIGCLGLFGLASHTARRRTKEIGVRKVLGASVASLVNMLAKDFLKLVLIAIVIAAPVAIFLMKKWLADFAYRINIEWWMVAATAVGAVAIAFLTVSFQSIKAAVADPVKSLRSE